MTYPCANCNRDDGYPICLGDQRCLRTDGVQVYHQRPAWANEALERLKARLMTDPEAAKALLPNMTHAEVKAALQKRPA